MLAERKLARGKEMCLNGLIEMAELAAKAADGHDAAVGAHRRETGDDAQHRRGRSGSSAQLSAPCSAEVLMRMRAQYLASIVLPVKSRR
jgi:hypothetical protein